MVGVAAKASRIEKAMILDIVPIHIVRLNNESLTSHVSNIPLDVLQLAKWLRLCKCRLLRAGECWLVKLQDFLKTRLRREG
jgi:hypothetical protein